VGGIFFTKKQYWTFGTFYGRIAHEKNKKCSLLMELPIKNQKMCIVDEFNEHIMNFFCLFPHI